MGWVQSTNGAVPAPLVGQALRNRVIHRPARMRSKPYTQTPQHRELKFAVLISSISRHPPISSDSSNKTA